MSRDTGLDIYEFSVSMPVIHEILRSYSMVVWVSISAHCEYRNSVLRKAYLL